MSLITINQELCSQDGHCVAECPARIIKMIDKTPEVPVEMESYCIDCGHCVAVCPHAALTLKTLDVEDCLPVDKSLHLSEVHVEHFLRARRSIRNFKNKPVEKALLQKVFDIVRYAPTASNKQPVHWLFLEQEKAVKKVVALTIDWIKYIIKNEPEMANEKNFDKVVAAFESGADPICRGAKHLLFCYANKTLTSAGTDCAIAMTHVELILPSFGLGDCWAGYVTYAAQLWPPLVEYLNLPPEMEVKAAAMIGYPKYQYHRMPTRHSASVEWR
jgi:nitroreductase/NAD-dependent dihydropyrimidine dehydrogenase PreA subunit